MSVFRRPKRAVRLVPSFQDRFSPNAHDHLEEALREEIAARPWSDLFELDDPRQFRKARTIYGFECRDDAGFGIHKADRHGIGGMTGLSPRLAEYEEFPTIDMVRAMVSEQWGGGLYEIKPSSRPSIVLHSYVLEGPSKSPYLNKDGSRTPMKSEAVENLKARIIELFGDVVLNDPAIGKSIAIQLIAKELGVPAARLTTKKPKEKTKTLEERLILERIAEDPEVRRKITDALLASKFGIKDEEEKEKPLIERLREVEAVGKAMGWQPPGQVQKTKGRHPEGDPYLGKALLALVSTGQLQSIIERIIALMQHGRGGQPQLSPGQQPAPPQLTASPDAAMDQTPARPTEPETPVQNTGAHSPTPVPQANDDGGDTGGNTAQPPVRPSDGPLPATPTPTGLRFEADDDDEVFV